MGPAANTANALARALLETVDLDNAEKWYRTGYETASKIQNVPRNSHRSHGFANSQSRIIVISNT
jgi:hypothetical protein